MRHRPGCGAVAAVPPAQAECRPGGFKPSGAAQPPRPTRAAVVPLAEPRRVGQCARPSAGCPNTGRRESRSKPRERALVVWDTPQSCGIAASRASAMGGRSMRRTLDVGRSVRDLGPTPSAAELAESRNGDVRPQKLQNQRPRISLPWRQLGRRVDQRADVPPQGRDPGGKGSLGVLRQSGLGRRSPRRAALNLATTVAHRVGPAGGPNSKPR